MVKREEVASPDSCLNRARDDEYVFVLLGRDVATPAAIRAWAAERVRLGKNGENDPQLQTALADARRIEAAHGLAASRGQGAPA